MADQGTGSQSGDLERLARFEAVLVEMVDDWNRTSETLEHLRAEGKTKSATYRQLTARRLSLKSTLASFERHGLLPEQTSRSVL